MTSASVAESAAQEVLRPAEAEITREEFSARFKARLLARVGPTDGEGDDVAEYADDVAQTYYDEPDQRAEGPEECADIDLSYWE